MRYIVLGLGIFLNQNLYNYVFLRYFKLYAIMANKKRKKGGVKKMGEGAIGKILALAMWITGILVSLAVGFGMISGTLTIPYVEVIVPIAGWIVVVLTLASVVLGIVDRF